MNAGYVWCLLHHSWLWGIGRVLNLYAAPNLGSHSDGGLISQGIFCSLNGVFPSVSSNRYNKAKQLTCLVRSVCALALRALSSGCFSLWLQFALRSGTATRWPSSTWMRSEWSSSAHSVSTLQKCCRRRPRQSPETAVCPSLSDLDFFTFIGIQRFTLHSVVRPPASTRVDLVTCTLCFFSHEACPKKAFIVILQNR